MQTFHFSFIGRLKDSRSLGVIIMAIAQQITKKRKAVQDGVFKAELNNFLMKELAEDGYSGVEVRRTPARAEVIFVLGYAKADVHAIIFR